jgi:transcriptional antiterminator RfaH
MNSATTHADFLWYCVRTQTKREHIAAQLLRTLEQVEVFCPRLRYRKATRRGKIWWIEPMFPGYILARFDLEAMERSVTFTQGVRGLVRFGNEIPSIPTSFVDAIRRQTVAHSETADPECITLTPEILTGDEIEVAHGPLRGMHGTVVKILPAAERVRILLEFLGRPNVIEVDLFSLILPRKPVPKPV